MSNESAVWGIEIGQTAIKALRCRLNSETKEVEAVAFDYVEYPNLLTEPSVDAPSLVKEAMQKFLSRNDTKQDRVIISAPGQQGLARMIKLPPVEASKISDIVKYEARQQIPFPLDEVVWDYQQLGPEVEGDELLLDTQVGIFAMRHELVMRAMEPFQDAGIEVDTVQLTPSALCNFFVYDRLEKGLISDDEYDPDDPPPTVAVLSLGTEASDLICTDGFTLWTRSIPIGGNHFTQALMKKFDLSFAKAEHLKRNATHSEDPKAVFQAMRPVFNNLANDCQRSLGFYQNLYRNAKIKHIVAIGSLMKLPGIRTFLQQNLGHDVVRLDRFQRLQGPNVVNAPEFQEHFLSFATAYGLALQGLVKTKIRTNLLPDEIEQERMIRAKKPWALAAAACLLLGLTLNSLGYWRGWAAVHDDQFTQAETLATSKVNYAGTQQREFEDSKLNLQSNKQLGFRLVENLERRWYSLELLKAINLCLPQNQTKFNPQAPEEPAAPSATTNPEEAVKSFYESIVERDDIHITQLQMEYVEDLSVWWQAAQRLQKMVSAGGSTSEDAFGSDDLDFNFSSGGGGGGEEEYYEEEEYYDEEEGYGGGSSGGFDEFSGEISESLAQDPGPSGPGYIIRLVGHHYHNQEDNLAEQGTAYLQSTLIESLKKPYITIRDEDGNPFDYPIKIMGIRYPMIIRASSIDWNYDIAAGEDRTLKRSSLIDSSVGRSTALGGSSDDYYEEEEYYEEEYYDEDEYGSSSSGSRQPTIRLGEGDVLPEEAKQENTRVPRQDFIVNFIFQPQSTVQREREMVRVKQEEEQAAANFAAGEPGNNNPANPAANPGNPAAPANPGNPNVDEFGNPIDNFDSFNSTSEADFNN
ncbi:Type IV pilus assembly protein PilM [Planctomycetales bacterium 10988]|nr:Type IV pilus assembly protein PilM [Planctomycetales bacterium 10988]